ncbi:uncharacterized protein BDZ99DRAFT_125571 [Mytilinidion resinicola]|uniref:Uncharacterized protein n=1 Tax=Mytilinidion resinicola TaxID=574789 RepID=A0A6A6Z6J5_9PEZI|nr:uncharacterized protein BDZ99DRAFT_125571 [Mytilinidion resinicola]KAF2815914.1 hypothetical protein BDZ99DRAFT_125571 [Mytilinidion resinicola]
MCAFPYIPLVRSCGLVASHHICRAWSVRCGTAEDARNRRRTWTTPGRGSRERHLEKTPANFGSHRRRCEIVERFV